MIEFFAAAMMLLSMVVALVVYPLLRRHDDRFEQRGDDVVVLARKRLAELRRRHQGGELGDAEYAEQTGDLEAQLADDLEARDSNRSDVGWTGGPRMAVAVIIVVIPVLSGMLYLTLGEPRALFPGAGTRPGSASADGEHPVDVKTMVSRLAQRLEENPNDAEGWFMLGRSYMVLGQYERAVAAFGGVRELAGDSPEILVRQAEAIAMTRNGALAGRPARMVQRALEKQPDHTQALWMAATAAYQAGEYGEALKYYRRVEPRLTGEERRHVADMVRTLVQQGYGQEAAGGSTASNTTPVSLRVRVTLDPSLQNKVSSRDTVFIFAKAVDGPAMPLAVVKQTVAALPTTVTLDDSRAMMPQLKLSGFEKVRVGARVSSNGGPMAQPGDLEGESPPVTLNDSHLVEVAIDRVVADEQ